MKYSLGIPKNFSAASGREKKKNEKGGGREERKGKKKERREERREKKKERKLKNSGGEGFFGIQHVLFTLTTRLLLPYSCRRSLIALLLSDVRRDKYIQAIKRVDCINPPSSAPTRGNVQWRCVVIGK